MKNYRVTSTTDGFVIELDTAVSPSAQYNSVFFLFACLHASSSLQVTVSSLIDVLNYFLEKTEYRYHPYGTPQLYNTCIGEKNTAVTVPGASAQLLTMFICVCVCNRHVTCSKACQYDSTYI